MRSLRATALCVAVLAGPCMRGAAPARAEVPAAAATPDPLFDDDADAGPATPAGFPDPIERVNRATFALTRSSIAGSSTR
jgi:hypothetical protein